MILIHLFFRYLSDKNEYSILYDDGEKQEEVFEDLLFINTFRYTFSFSNFSLPSPSNSSLLTLKHFCKKKKKNLLVPKINIYIKNKFQKIFCGCSALSPLFCIILLTFPHSTLYRKMCS